MLMKLHWIARYTSAVAVIVLVGAGFVLLMLVSVGVLNSELYGRLTETQAVTTPHAFAKPSSELPLLRLVLHRIVPDENAIEASIILILDSGDSVAKEIRSGKTRLVAVVRDGSAIHPYALHSQTILDADAFESNVGSAASQSHRFLLPAYPSMGTYPFDDLRVRPMLTLQRYKDFYLPFRVEIQKALPGRLLVISGDPSIVEIRLTRTPTEKAFVMSASVIFFVLSLIIAFGLFSVPGGLTSFEELLTVAGYLVAAAGFRNLLGVSRVAGTSILEIVIMGVPLVLLSFGIAVSMYRGRRAKPVHSAHDQQS